MTHIDLGCVVNLPEFIAHTTMDADSVAVLQDGLSDLLKFVLAVSALCCAEHNCS